MIRTNIKMRVTLKQLIEIGKIIPICKSFTNAKYIFIYKDGRTTWSNNECHFDIHENKEIDPELFIRTNGSCTEWWERIPDPDLATDKSNNKAKNPNSKHYELWENFEAIDVIKLALTDEEYKGFLKGNILKYQLRLGKKDDVSKEIEKIKDYQRELNK